MTTLSGMSTMDQLKENIAIYEKTQPLSAQENAALFEIAKDLTDAVQIPCTKCKYCLDHCPQNLDIPWLIEVYNEFKYSKNKFGASLRLNEDTNKRPTACIGCQSCEAVCPQSLPIAKTMTELAELFG